MAGDDLVEHPIHVTTRAVTIRAERADVWPWLVQMGYGRGGMYSYDFVDRVMGILDRESTWQIMPEHQHLEVGSIIPMGSGPSWPVAALEPCRVMVLHIQEPGSTSRGRTCWRDSVGDARGWCYGYEPGWRSSRRWSRCWP